MAALILTLWQIALPRLDGKVFHAFHSKHKECYYLMTFRQKKHVFEFVTALMIKIADDIVLLAEKGKYKEELLKETNLS